MDRECLAKFICGADVTIVDAMKKIDDNSRGILFVVDGNDRLTGSISDGDIRRWLLRTGDLNANVCSVMMRSPKYLFNRDRYQAEKLMNKKTISAVPILDDSRRITDIILRVDINLHRKKSLAGIPVIIMAGGKGTRLYPYTKILPKPLIPIGETPIVERIIDCYVEYGIDKFYMTVNFKKSMLRSYFAELSPSYEIEYIEEKIPLGTAGSLKLIEKKFKNPIFVTNCDALIFADYDDLYNYHVNSGNIITIVSALKNITIPYGVMKSKENGEIYKMEEKPMLSYFINTGMYVIDPDSISKIPNDVMFHMTQLVDVVMKSGGKVGMYPISEDSFLDMGEFSEMKRMEEKLHIIFN